MKNAINNIRNRCKLYAGIIIGSFIMGQIISAITGVGTENTWLAFVVVTIVVLTMVIMLFDVSKVVKSTRPRLAYLLQFFIFAIITSVMFVLAVLLIL